MEGIPIAKENRTRFVILGLLNHEPLSGYDIKKIIENSISYFWEASFGQIYPTLKQLEADGLVQKEVQLNESGPNRKVYTITDSGQRELCHWLSIPAQAEVIKYEILLKLFFGRSVPMQTNLLNIRGFKERTSESLAHLKEFETILRQVPDSNQDHQFYLLTLLFGKYMFEAQIHWAEEAEVLLKNISGGSHEKTSKNS